MTITEFLEARIADDEAVAREASTYNATWPRNRTWWLEGVKHDVVGEEEAFCHPHNAEHIARHDPARVLAECAAKRAIIALADDVEYMDDRITSEWGGPNNGTADDILKALAAVYADHPDYRQDWAL